MALSLQWILVKTLHSLILLDSSAAFDTVTVDHSIILTRLQNWFGFDGLSHLISLLALKQSQSMILHSISAFSTLSPGVPQGFVLDPHLFILYTTPLGSLMQKSLKYHLYDDILMKPSCTMCTSLSSLISTNSALFLESPPLSLTFSPR